jgi:hypothetical protein
VLRALGVVSCTLAQSRCTLGTQALRCASWLPFCAPFLQGEDGPSAFDRVLPRALCAIAVLGRRLLISSCMSAVLSNNGLLFRDESVVLTGCARMLVRPIAPLVEALTSMGARLEYVGAAGQLPLRVFGGGLSGGTVSVKSVDSSQFVSSLLMAAPLASGPVTIAVGGCWAWFRSSDCRPPAIRCNLELCVCVNVCMCVCVYVCVYVCICVPVACVMPP